MRTLRLMALMATTIAPGLFAIGLCTYYLFPEWAALDRAYQGVAVLNSDSSPPQVAIAIAAEQRHRINCFAEGVGVLVGGVLLGIGTHGLYLGLARTEYAVDPSIKSTKSTKP